MNVRDKKGSITIFVLVGLLFMTGFLIISFGSNINKSKIAKEQFNIISSIYSKGDSDADAYERAYTALRRKNAQMLTSSNEGQEDTSTLELTKTFEDKLSNYRIYGNSMQNGTPSPTNPVEVESVGDLVNLFNPEAELEKVGVYLGVNTTGINKNYTLKIKLKEGKTVPAGIYFGFVHYNAEASTSASAEWIISNGTLNTSYGDGSSYGLITFNPGDYYLTGICCHSGTQEVWDSVMDAFEITWVEGIYTAETIPEYVEYGKYRISLEIENSVNSPKNLFTTDNATIGANLQENGYAINNSNYNTTDYIPILANKEYSWSFQNNYATSVGTSRRIVAYDENKNVISMLYYNTLYEIAEESVSIKTPANAKYLRIGYRVTDSNQVLKIKDTEQLQTKKQQINIYLNEPLRKVGDVADYIDFSTGKVIRKIKELQLNGENWTTYHNSQRPDGSWAYYGFMTTKEVLEAAAGRLKGLSNMSPYVGQYYSQNNAMWLGVSSRGIYWIKNDYYDASLEDYGLSNLKERLNSYPLKIYYEAQVDLPQEDVELPELNTYEDYTKIEVLTEVAPSKIEATYYGYTME